MSGLRISWLVLLMLPIACGDGGVSDSTRAERQDLAFDVSGHYAEDAASGLPSRLTIENEASVHDIAATLELRGGLRAEDRSALKAALRTDDGRLTDAEVEGLAGKIEAAMVSLAMARGVTFSERGGENVATDHAGDLAEIALRKSVGEIGRAQGSTYTATVSLFLTGYRAAPRLDAQATAYTDKAGRGEHGSKGLLLTVSRDSGGVTRSVTDELRLQLGALLKY